MNDVFKINTKIKPLVKIPDFTFIDYHNLQQSVCYYIRKYDDHNDFDFMEAKIVKTGNKVKDRYTLGSGTSIKILDSFMYYYLKERELYDNRNKIFTYKDFVKGALEDANITDKTIIERYSDGTIPEEFKFTDTYKDLIKKDYQVLYVSRSPKEKKIEQYYIVFVQEIKQDLMGTEINYVNFKPVHLITSLDYIKNKSKDKYLVHEYEELHIPTSILK